MDVLPTGVRNNAEPIGQFPDPVEQFYELERQKNQGLALARDAEIGQQQLLSKHAANPEMKAAVEALRRSGRRQAEREPLPIERFFEPSAILQDSSQSRRTESLADRSKWSPKLRKLVEETWPEEGKEERIRRATEKPIPTLGKSLSIEAARYFAEDPDFLYGD